MKTENNFETIHLPNQIILVDKEAEIKIGDCGLSVSPIQHPHTIVIANDSNVISIQEHWNKIIGSNPQLGELPLLPLPDDEVEKLAFLELVDTLGSEKRAKDAVIANDYFGLKIIEVFTKSYKSATKTFTKEDMIGFAEWINKNFIFYKNGWSGGNEKGYDILKNKEYASMEELLQLYLDQKQKPQFIPTLNDDGSLKTIVENGKSVLIGIFK